MPYIDFLKNHRTFQLEFLWNQWAPLGISGYGTPTSAIADPDALLLYSLIVSRFDARLYDEIIEWTILHRELLSIPRLRSLLTIIPAHRELGALAELQVEKDRFSKWKPLIAPASDSAPEPLFTSIKGDALPITGEPDLRFLRAGLLRNRWDSRNHAQQFNPETGSALILKLRALLGVTARAEIVASLIGGEEKHPALIAKENGYAQSTVQGAIVQMAQSGFLFARMQGKVKMYQLNPSFAEAITESVISHLVPWILLFDLSLHISTLFEKATKINPGETAFLALFRTIVDSFENRLLDAGVDRELLKIKTLDECADFLPNLYRRLLG